MGCNALKIQKELTGEVLKEHFPGVSENSVLATKFVGPALFKLARHHLSAVAKVNKLDNKLKDRLLDFGINEKSNQAQAGNGNKATNEKSTKIPSWIFDSSGNQLDLNGTKEEAITKLDKYKKEFTKAIENIGSEPDYDAKTVKYWEDMFKKRLAEVQEDLDDVSNGVYDKEFKNTENAATGFQGYVGGFEDKGKGTPEGDGKDKAMRKVANGFIGESVTPIDVQSLKQIKPTSSTVTSFKEIGIKVSHNDYSNTGVTLVSGTDHTIVMLARNSEFKGKPLAENTKDNILESYKDGATFVVGDMPGVDTQFIEYLNEIGASYKIYHTGSTARIKEEVKVDKTVVETNTNVASTKVGILNGKVGMLSKTGKSLETKVEIKSMEQLIDLAADFNTAIEEYHGREIKDESVDHIVSMFKELVSVKDFKPFTLKFNNSVEGLGLATGNSTITMTTNADAYKKVFGSPIRIVLHEYVHTITQMEMKNNPNNEVVKKIQALYDRVKNREELKGEYGLTDVYEFVAEALSNPRFQTKLDKIGSKHTLVNKVKELFKSLLTWRKDKGEVTALDEILDLAVSLKNEKLNDAGNNKQAYQAEAKQEDATILDKNADKTANNLYKWAKECAK